MENTFWDALVLYHIYIFYICIWKLNTKKKKYIAFSQTDCELQVLNFSVESRGKKNKETVYSPISQGKKKYKRL